MRSFGRHPVPDFLTERWEAWGVEYADRKRHKLSAQFTWDKPGFQKINQRILPVLRAQTQDHCSYCDHWPPRLGDETIDHFKPKGDERFYDLAYQWENLYFCCWHCQKSKGERYDEATLWPDDPDYTFNRYFIFKTTTGEVEPNPAASPEEKIRAVVTIREMGFNQAGQPIARKKEWERFQNDPEQDVSEFAYRFLFE